MQKQAPMPLKQGNILTSIFFGISALTYFLIIIYIDYCVEENKSNDMVMGV